MADPTSDPALADPMFHELRRRHPDVDVVLLPAPEPDSHPPLASTGQVRALRAHVDAVLATLSRRLGVQPRESLGLWWQQAHPLAHRRVVRAAFVSGSPDRPPSDLLRTVADELVALGWETRPAADGSPRVRAVADPVEVVAEATGSALAVRLTSTPLWVAPQALADDEAAS